jgi:hypothetical protein
MGAAAIPYPEIGGSQIRHFVAILAIEAFKYPLAGIALSTNQNVNCGCGNLIYFAVEKDKKSSVLAT